MTGKKYLTLKFRTWWFHRDIPQALRPQFGGRKTLTQNLHTSDVRVAQARRDAAFRESELLFTKAANARPDPVLEQAIGWADAWKRWQDDPRGWQIEAFGEAAVDDEEGGGAPTLPSMFEDAAEAIARQHGDAARDRFIDLGRGAAPLDAHLDAHLREAAISPRTAQERRTAVRRLAEWKPTLNLQNFGRKQAGQYVSDVLASGNAKTGNKAISNLSSYWKWLVKRGHVTENPWLEQRLNERRKAAGERERAFRADEVRRLLTANYPAGMEPEHEARLRDLMRIAALSGMRIEEICQLLVSDTGGGLFNIRKAKTAAGVRQVPIHPELTAIIARRCEGKQPDDYLFHDIDKVTGERSMPVSKQFTRYRRAVGVDDRSDGRRRSKANFHSWRRWFVTEAERAGQPPHIIEVVVGHRRAGMSLGVYSEGPSVEQQMRACVEAVRLPESAR